MRKDLSNRRVLVGTVGAELADAIIERKATFLHAPQHERRRDNLTQPVEVEWRVGPGCYRPFVVLAAKGLLPDDFVWPDDQGREARYGSLNTERFEILPKAPKHFVVRIVESTHTRVLRLQGRADQRHGYHHDQ